MLVFYCIIAVMIAISLIVISRALLKNADSPPANSKQVSLDIYQEQLVELQRDRESGVLSEEQLKSVQAELEQSLLDEVNVSINKSNTSKPPSTRKVDYWTVAVVSLLLPIMAGVLYYNLGQPELIINLKDDSSQQVGDEAHKNMPSVEEMADLLAQRLLENPDDAKGWSMLSRTYMAQGRFQDAVNAYKRLHALVGDQPDVLVSYADALSMANNRSLAGEPEKLLLKALSVDPNNIIGLWLAGRMEDEKGQYDRAVDYWQRLLPMLQKDPKSEMEVRQLIKAAQANLGIPETEQIALAITESDSPDLLKNSITVNVELDPGLMETVDREAILFIFAQALNGPPMPLAAVRKQVKDLPLQVKLDDSMAMIPTQKLSSHIIVKVSARISKSGGALPQSGDLMATPVQFTMGLSDPVSLVIDTRIP